MKILPVLLVFTALPAFAQTPAAPAASPKPRDASQAQPAASPTPAASKARATRATPLPRVAQPTASPTPVRRAVRVTPDNRPKPGFFARIFGSKPKQAAAPAPAASPTATPASVATRRKKTPTVSTTPAPSEGVDTAAPALPETTRSVATPRISKPSTSVKVTPTTHEEAPANATIPRGVTDPAPEGDETPYQRARREAARDPQIAALGEKLNAANPGDDYKAAAREYTAALFTKMREIDPSQTEWFNRMEGATIRRIDAGKPFVAE